MNEKKIMLLVPLFMSYDLFFKGLCAQLTAAGWQVWVGTRLPEQLDKTAHPVTFIPFDLPRKFEIGKYFTAATQLRKCVNSIKPSIVHAHFQPAALVVRLSGINRLTTTLTTSHGLVFNTMHNKLKAKVFKCIEVFIYRGFKKVWVLTKSDQQALQDQVPNLQTYPTKGLGCDSSTFDPARFSSEETGQLKQALGFQAADFIFIFVGRMTDFKGIDVVYRAFLVVQKKHKHTRLLILGDVDPLHPSGLTAQELANLKTNPAIKHLGFTSDVAKYLAMAHVLVFPSAKEGMPVNLMEAICMGVPIITLNSRGCVDIVGDAYGLVLETKTAAACASAMKHLVTDAATRNAISARQLQDRHLFDRKEYVAYQIKAYEELISNNQKDELTSKILKK